MRSLAVIRTLILCLVAGLGLSSCADLYPPDGQGASQVYGVDVKGRNVLFVLDVSGSMEGRDEVSPTGQIIGATKGAVGSLLPPSISGLLMGQVDRQLTRLQSARRALGRAIDGLPDSTSFQLLVYGDRVEYWPAQAIRANAQGKELARKYLDQLHAWGTSTGTLGALNAALRKDTVDQIILISDGEPTDAEPARIISEMRARNGGRRRVPISAVGVGTNTEASRFLQSLATENGGQYARASGWF